MMAGVELIRLSRPRRGYRPARLPAGLVRHGNPCTARAGGRRGAERRHPADGTSSTSMTASARTSACRSCASHGSGGLRRTSCDRKRPRALASPSAARDFLRAPQVQMVQGDEVLSSGRLARLVPGRSTHVPQGGPRGSTRPAARCECGSSRGSPSFPAAGPAVQADRGARRPGRRDGARAERIEHESERVGDHVDEAHRESGARSGPSVPGAQPEESDQLPEEAPADQAQTTPAPPATRPSNRPACRARRGRPRATPTPRARRSRRQVVPVGHASSRQGPRRLPWTHKAGFAALFAVGLLLLFLDPPSLSARGDGDHRRLSPRAGAAHGLGSRGCQRQRLHVRCAVERLVKRSVELAREPSLRAGAGELDILVADAIDNLPPKSSGCSTPRPRHLPAGSREPRLRPLLRRRRGPRQLPRPHRPLPGHARARLGSDPDLLRAQVERTLRHELAHRLGWPKRGVGGLGHQPRAGSAAGTAGTGSRSL